MPKEKIDLVREAGLDGLIHLLSNEEARVSQLTPQIINMITKNGMFIFHSGMGGWDGWMGGWVGGGGWEKKGWDLI